MRIVITRASDDDTVDRPAPFWGANRLADALRARGAEVVVDTGPEGVAGATGDLVIRAGGRASTARAGIPPDSLAALERPEGFAVVAVGSPPGSVLLAGGADERGLAYALAELADRVACADDAREALALPGPIIGRPANRIRSVTRLFSSEHHDLPWFADPTFWGPYLDMLATHRFNRFSLTLGLGYNFPWGVTDAYLQFAYPFLVDVPGYDVTVTGIDARDRLRNLEVLQRASRETVRRGMAFQLGLWNHAYEWMDSPAARHVVGGLRPETHAAYCRDALVALLEACPDIGGVTFRIHGESGIPERSWAFWRTLFEAFPRLDRPVEIDLHAKGLDAETLRLARATGMPITVSPKFWAEHTGLPYHQAAIRDQERRVVDLETATGKQGFMRVSEGARPFTRYGFGDFLREDRDYAIVHRIWPGTQRVLLWGDPAMAAAYGRAAGIADGDGFEWMEPLTFRGREGVPGAGSRDGYADRSLAPAWDSAKYEYWYRLVGRLGYDPGADPAEWRRFLRHRHGPAADRAEEALAAASRILPLVTTAFHPSASNNYYWPELHSHVRVVRADGDPPVPFVWDTPSPDRAGTVTPLDPELFASVADAVTEALAGKDGGRYTPLDVARWLDDLAARARAALDAFRRASPAALPPDSRRLDVDVTIAAALGRYFAGAFRAAVHHELYLRTDDAARQSAAIDALVAARDAYAEAARAADGVYVADLAFGTQAWLRGTWADRLEAIETDLARLRELRPAETTARAATSDRIARWLARHEVMPPMPPVRHRAPATFDRGRPIRLELEVDDDRAGEIVGAQVRYRPMDQSRVHEAFEMARDPDRACRFAGEIPGAATDTPFPVQYHVVVRGAAAWQLPGLGPDLCRQPYFVVRRRGRG